MIDIHTHILLNVDDGSPDIRTTAKMLREEMKRGVETVCFTPHFYASKTPMDLFKKKRSLAVDQVKGLIPEEERPDYVLGAEVAYFPGICRVKFLNELCFKNTDTILLEMPFEKWTISVLDDVKGLILDRRLNVVLAHLERYADIRDNRRNIAELMQYPVIVQVNVGSLLKKGKTRRHAVSLLKDAKYALIASDCHGIHLRSPNIDEGYEIAEEKVYAGFSSKSNLVAKEILNLT